MLNQHLPNSLYNKVKKTLKKIHSENIILTGTHKRKKSIDLCVCLCCYSAAHHLFERAHGGYPNLSLSRCTALI